MTIAVISLQLTNIICYLNYHGYPPHPQDMSPLFTPPPPRPIVRRFGMTGIGPYFVKSTHKENDGPGLNWSSSFLLSNFRFDMTGSGPYCVKSTNKEIGRPGPDWWS